MQQDVPELERRLTELQSQINRLSLSLHLWQERQDRLLEQRLTDWNAIEARAQKDASTRMRELQETIEHEWSELRQVQQDPNQYVRELGSNLGQKLSELTDQVQAVVTELRANGVTQGAVVPGRNAFLAARRCRTAAQSAARLAGRARPPASRGWPHGRRWRCQKRRQNWSNGSSRSNER